MPRESGLVTRVIDLGQYISDANCLAEDIEKMLFGESVAETTGSEAIPDGAPSIDRKVRNYRNDLDQLCSKLASIKARLND